ncbi:tetratricopeptide repeat protein [Gemmatimonas sp. UBA7669]|uniref:tetratricopeptide repeat protein n=1 Tax=Gemmatimonas sp. UBA7669 TaxID=1946568 RepID=UPI0025C02172|nr:tetratricopeptide repeat protein [Gemmatimonas sp. UBA7669]
MPSLFFFSLTTLREPMTWWRRLVGGSSGRDPRQPDFLSEALDLESRGDYANALTSYRLALREHPDDLRVLQNIAIAFSKTGQPEEAIRTYRRALQLDADLPGAHYGLAFLLLKRGDTAHAGMHLEAFLRVTRADDAGSAKFRAHAERTLTQLQGNGFSEQADATSEDGMHEAPGDESVADGWTDDRAREG